jgi:hypothetical protein
MKRHKAPRLALKKRSPTPEISGVGLSLENVSAYREGLAAA